MDVNQAYQVCRQIIEHHSKTFAKAFNHLPKEKREGVWAVYAFCRLADDIVDEGENPETELKAFKEDFDTFVAGDIPEQTALWIALNDAFKRFDFDHTPFYDMIKGQYMDLTKKRYESLDEVLTYSYHVAGTVGLMLLPILSPDKKDELYDSAVSLGYAMQITNILRDVGEDLDRDRIYLPREILAKHGYTSADLENHVLDDRFIAIWEELAAIAETHYLKGTSELNLYPLFARLPVKAAASFYKAILNAVRRNGYQVFHERAYVTQDEKAKIIETSINESHAR